MPTDASAWSLHSQLKKDTIDIGDLPLCRVLVIKDAHYPWLLLVPRREGAVEIIDLDEVAQAHRVDATSAGCAGRAARTRRSDRTPARRSGTGLRRAVASPG